MKPIIRTLGCAAGLIALAIAVPVTLTGCASTSTRESSGQYVDDSAITTKVKAEYAKDPTVSALRVHVETFKGVVQLSGFVNSKEEAARAEQVARSVSDVKDVRNNLVVK